jgi:4-amino-4-deoxy-L-arabinose transferase-like glycosyltransferase
MIVQKIKIQNFSNEQKLLTIIIVATSIRLIFGLSGLGMDETYTVATSRHLSLSYFDHPPMAWWLSGVMQWLTHSEAPIIVRLPFILISALSIWRMYLLTQVLFGEAAALFASFVFSVAPVLGMTSATWVLPDGPLIFALLTAAYYLARLFFDVKPDPRLWLAAGFWGGIAMVSKYHGIFLFAGAGLFIVTSPLQSHWLRRPWPYLGAGLGLLIFSPVIIWNVDHHWISFSFQSGRTGVPEIHLLKPFVTLAGNALFLFPWIWLGSVAATLIALKSRVTHPQRWLMLCLGLPLVVLFLCISALSSTHVFYHWSMPGYLLLIPLLGEWISQKFEQYPLSFKCLGVLSVSIVFIIVTGVMVFWSFPSVFSYIGLRTDPIQDMRDFANIGTYIEDSGLADQRGLIVAPTKWFMAGKFDYALNGRFLVTCLCADARQYGVDAPLDQLVGRNFLIPVAAADVKNEDHFLSDHFEHVDRLDNLHITSHGQKIEEFYMFYGKNFHIN